MIDLKTRRYHLIL